MVRMRLANSIKIPPEKFNCCRPYYVRLVFQDVPTLTQTLQEKHGDLARVPDPILHPYCNPSDALNDFAQFVIQVLATTILFVVVLAELGGAGAIFGMWERLPEGHTSL